MIYEIGSLITSKWSKGAVWKIESYDEKSPGLVNLTNYVGGKRRQDYVEHFKPARDSDIARVTKAGRYGSRERVREFIRQWKINYSAEDKVYEVYFDNTSDDSAALLITDLEELLR